jgi:hypothetical protein
MIKLVLDQPDIDLLFSFFAQLSLNLSSEDRELDKFVRANNGFGKFLLGQELEISECRCILDTIGGYASATMLLKEKYEPDTDLASVHELMAVAERIEKQLPVLTRVK